MQNQEGGCFYGHPQSDREEQKEHRPGGLGYLGQPWLYLHDLMVNIVKSQKVWKILSLEHYCFSTANARFLADRGKEYNPNTPNAALSFITLRLQPV